MKFIWATRGLTWGFRFVRDGGFVDPLPEYEKAFTGLIRSRESWQLKDSTIALHFQDPEGRKDASGRPIPHDFVVFAPDAKDITSLDSGRKLVWPLVADEFEQIWNQPEPRR